MSNVDSVITTTTKMVVDSAKTAVSLGRWSNLAIIASSFLCVWEGREHPYAFLNHQHELRLIGLSDATSFVVVC